MRLPSFDIDGWELDSGEKLHRTHPELFWIPPVEARQNLQRGQAAKLVFLIEAVEESRPVIQGERIFVIVAERLGDYYIGILYSQPVSVSQDADEYLRFGAEIPFLPEHVIDIAEPPQEYVEWQLGPEPEQRWPRE